MHELAALVLLHVGDGEFGGFGVNGAMVGDLAAHFGVERSLVEDKNCIRAGRDRTLKLFVGDDGDDLALGFHVGIADEGRGGDLLAEFNAGPAEVAERLARLACADLLLLHELLEGRFIDLHPLFGDHFVGQVDGEAVGVIELERVRAGEGRLALGLVALEHFGEDLHAAIDGLGEVFFLGADDAGDIGLLFTQLGVLALVFMDDGVHDLIEERFVHAQQLAVTRGAAQQAAQDVAPALVGGENAVADHEGRRTDMVGDDAERHVGLVGLLIVCAGDLGDFIRDVHDSVDVEQGRDVLTHAGKAFEAHAGVDVLLLEFGIIAVAVVIELGEDDVPDLDIAVTVAADGAAGLAAAVLLAAVIVNFRARAARAGAMLPEVILLAEAEDAVFGDADHVAPDGEGLVICGGRLVAREDGRIEAIRLKADPLGAGQEFPCPGNGLLLEVIAEGEVAQHLKIRAVAGRMADVFNVAGADALLTGGDAVARRLFLAGEPRLHGSHARVDQQDGFVVLRNERKARQTQMALRFKELQVHLAQLIETVCLVCHDEILLLYTLKIKRYTVPETALGSPYGRAVAAGD